MMLLQTNSYIVPKDKRTEHSRLILRFRQTLARLGCDHFEAYEQVGANWSPTEATGRFVQIMRFRDRKHQQQVQAAERSDPGAQALIKEFCELINFPYQQQQGLFAVGFYTSLLPGTTQQRVPPPPPAPRGAEAAAPPEMPASPPPTPDVGSGESVAEDVLRQSDSAAHIVGEPSNGEPQPAEDQPQRMGEVNLEDLVEEGRAKDEPRDGERDGSDDRDERRSPPDPAMQFEP